MKLSASKCIFPKKENRILKKTTCPKAKSLVTAAAPPNGQCLRQTHPTAKCCHSSQNTHRFCVCHGKFFAQLPFFAANCNQLLYFVLKSVGARTPFFLLHSAFWCGQGAAFLAVNFVALLCYAFLAHAAQATFDAQSKKLASAGMDINAGGVIVEYLFDVIYVTWVAELASCISTKFWWLYAAIPAYALWKLGSGVVMPLLRLRNTPQMQPPKAANSAKVRKYQ